MNEGVVVEFENASMGFSIFIAKGRLWEVATRIGELHCSGSVWFRGGSRRKFGRKWRTMVSMGRWYATKTEIMALQTVKLRPETKPVANFEWECQIWDMAVAWGKNTLKERKASQGFHGCSLCIFFVEGEG